MSTLMRRLVAIPTAIAFALVTHDVSFSDTQTASPVPIASATPSATASATPTSSNTTVLGDLAHLVYTATGDLSADFVVPSDGYSSPTISQRFVVSTVRDAGVEIAVNGEVVPSKQIGKRVVVVKTGLTQYDYFGVMLKPGPNVVTITPLGADGLRGPSKTATIYGPGLPVSVKATLSHPLIADGATVQQIQIAAFDRWGHSAMPGATVKVSILDGDAQIGNAQVPSATPIPLPGSSAPPNQDPTGDNAPNHSLEAPLADGGLLDVPIHPGLVPGALHISIISGDVTDTETYYVDAYVRKPFVNGLLSVGTGAVPGPVNGDGQNDAGGAKRARAALFAAGKIGRASTLTFVYESQNRLSPLSSLGSFVDNPNERPYSTYGDSSTQSDGPHSNDHLFGRLDVGRSSIQWGQFNADTGGPNAVGGFHQLLSGAKAEVNTAGAHLSVFTAKNQVAYDSELLSASGLSTLSRPLHPDIVVGSDYLSLISLDRRTGAVVSSTPLQRNLDYTIDYATGTLRFINPPLPYDANFNPQSVLVQYEYQGVGVAAQTTGGKMTFDIGRNGATNLEFGYVNAASGTSNFALLQQTLSGKLPGGGWSVSHATSYGTVPNTVGLLSPAGGDGGSAFHAGYNQRRGNDTLSFDYQNTDAGYENPYGGLAVPGFASYRLSWQHAVPRKNQLTVSIDGQRNSGLGIENSQNNANLSYRQFLGQRLSVLLGLNVHTQHDGIIDPSSPVPVLASGSFTQTEVGLDYRPTSRITFNIDRTSTISGDNSQTTQPAQTVASLTYDMDKHGKLYVRELYSDAPVSAFAQATSTLAIATNSTRATQFGIERDLSPATTVTSDYLITQGGSGVDIYSALGVQEKFRIGKTLGGNLFVQSANARGVGAQGFTVWGATLNYAATNGLRAALAYQTRTGASGGSTLSAGFAGPINDNMAIVGSLNHAYSSGVTGTTGINDQVSVAFRPSQDDRSISLLGWTRTSGSSNFGGTGDDDTDVISFDQLYRPWYGLEIAGRFAYKLDGDAVYLAHTSLASLRVRQNIGRRFDIGAEVREQNAANIAGARATDFAAEAGVQIGGGARAAVGYNFSGSVDPTLTGQPERKGLYVTFTTLVDRIFGWGKQ